MDEESEVWIYPLAAGETLARCDWAPLYFDRLLRSRYVATVDPAAGFYGFILWAAAYRQDPAGTLPDDDVELCRLAGLGRDLDAWAEVRAGALYGWRPTSIEGAAPGDIGRLGHPTIAEISADTFARVAEAKQDAREGGRRKALSRVRKALAVAGLRSGFIDAPGTVESIAEILKTAGDHVTPASVRRAAEIHQTEMDRITGENVLPLRP